MKPGYLTTEFWLSAVSTVVTLLVVLGYVPVADAGLLQGVGGQLILAVFAVVTNGVVLVKYVGSRLHLKNQAEANRLMERRLGG